MCHESTANGASESAMMLFEISSSGDFFPGRFTPSLSSSYWPSCVMIRLRHGGGHKFKLPFCSDYFFSGWFTQSHFNLTGPVPCHP